MPMASMLRRFDRLLGAMARLRVKEKSQQRRPIASHVHDRPRHFKRYLFDATVFLA